MSNCPCLNTKYVPKVPRLMVYFKIFSVQASLCGTNSLLHWNQLDKKTSFSKIFSIESVCGASSFFYITTESEDRLFSW